MKIPSRNLLLLASTALALGSIPMAHAATNTWIGDSDNDFLNQNNWTLDTLPNFGTDVMRFEGPGSQGNTTITNVNLTMTNTGATAGTNLAQILFAAGPALTLSGGTITFGSAASNTYNNAILNTTSVTQTIGSNIVVDDGKAYTLSFVNSNTTGGLLSFTGNITGGSGAGTPGAISLSFGNTSTHNGNYAVSGNISAGGSTGVNITKRGSGVLTLSGTNALGNGTSAGLGQNEAGSVIRINGGLTTLNNGAANGWGGNNVTGISPVVQVSSGTLVAQSARNIRSSLLIDGGTLNISQNRLSFDATNGNKTFTMTGGALNYNDTAAANNFGIRFGGDNGAASAGGFGFTGTQSGGVFTVAGSGGQDTVFSLGSTTASVTSLYALSGGTLDLQGSTGSNAFLTIGADAAGTSTTTFTLSGSGKLVVRSSTTTTAGGSNGGINGRTAAATQVLSLQGGTLVAGRIDAANLRGSIGGSNGTIVNNGSAIAAGDLGEAGRTAVVGNLTVTTGSLLLDIGGTTAATTWQNTSTGLFDNIVVTGNVSLGGTLSVSLIDTFDPLNTDSFTVLTSTGLTGAFSNVAFGDRITTVGGEGSFLVSQSGNNVVLSDYQVIPEPTTAALLGLGLGAVAVLRRRRNR